MTKLISIFVVAVIMLGLIFYTFKSNIGPAIVIAVTSVKTSITSAF